MIKIDNILTDFNKIANEIQQNTSKVNEANFLIRVVVCYENTDKNNENYTKLMNAMEQLNNVNFVEKRKQNKYFYLLNKNDFENKTDFEKLQQMFCKKDKNDNYKIITINTNNFLQYEKLLNLAIKIEIAYKQFQENK